MDTTICVVDAVVCIHNIREKKQEKQTEVNSKRKSGMGLPFPPLLTHPIRLPSIPLRQLSGSTNFFIPLSILMLKNAYRPLHSVFTRFLIERDQLTAHMARFGSGFILENQVKIAKEHLDNIKAMIDEVEARKSESLKFDCFSGQCYKK